MLPHSLIDWYFFKFQETLATKETHTRPTPPTDLVHLSKGSLIYMYVSTSPKPKSCPRTCKRLPNLARTNNVAPKRNLRACVLGLVIFRRTGHARSYTSAVSLPRFPVLLDITPCVSTLIVVSSRGKRGLGRGLRIHTASREAATPKIGLHRTVERCATRGIRGSFKADFRLEI